MPLYRIDIKQETYYHLEIEADNKDEAEDEAWLLIEEGDIQDNYKFNEDSWRTDVTIESIREKNNV